MAIMLPSSSTNSNIAIIGGVIGGLAALGILSLSAYILFRRRKLSKGMVVDHRVPIDDDMTIEGHPSMNEFNRLYEQGEVMAIGALPDEPSSDPPPYTSQEGRVSPVAPLILRSTPKPGDA